MVEYKTITRPHRTYEIKTDDINIDDMYVLDWDKDTGKLYLGDSDRGQGFELSDAKKIMQLMGDRYESIYSTVVTLPDEERYFLIPQKCCCDSKSGSKHRTTKYDRNDLNWFSHYTCPLVNLRDMKTEPCEWDISDTVQDIKVAKVIDIN